MSTVVSYDAAAHRALQHGFDTVASLVRVTHGPAGRSVVFGTPNGVPIASQDAREIAAQVTLSDPLLNVGASLAREVIVKIDDRVGLGGTTAVILAQAIIAAGMRAITAGANPVGLRRGIEQAATRATAALRAHSIPLDSAPAVAALATGMTDDPSVGDLLAEAFNSIGPLGIVTVETMPDNGITLDLDRGVALDRGYLSAEMVTDPERSETVLTDPYVLIFDGVVSANSDFIPVLEQVVSAHAQLFIVAINVDGEALATITMNMRQKLFTVAAIKASWLAERRKAILTDIAVFTGGTVIGEATGTTLASTTLEQLGRARRVTVGRHRSLIVDGAGDPGAIAQRVRQLELEQETAGSPLERERLDERIAKLSGGVGVLRVGARSQVELHTTVRRLEQTVAATRSAIGGGVVPGGGTALAQVAADLSGLAGDDDETVGIDALRSALSAPLGHLAANAGRHAAAVVAEVAGAPWGHGLDLRRSGITDLVRAGVLYPTEVACAAVDAAASIAALVLTTDAIVAERPDPAAMPDDLGWHGRDMITDPAAQRSQPRPPAHWRRSGASRGNTVNAPSGRSS